MKLIANFLFVATHLCGSVFAFIESAQQVRSITADIELSIVAEKAQRVTYKPTAHTRVPIFDWGLVQLPRMQLSEEIVLGSQSVDEIRFDSSTETMNYVCKAFGFKKYVSVRGISRTDRLANGYVFFKDETRLSLRKQKPLDEVITTLTCEGKGGTKTTKVEQIRATITAVKQRRLSLEGDRLLGIFQQPKLALTPALATGKKTIDSIAVQSFGRTKDFCCIEFGYSKYREFPGVTKLIKTRPSTLSFYINLFSEIQPQMGEYPSLGVLTCV